MLEVRCSLTSHLRVRLSKMNKIDPDSKLFLNHTSTVMAQQAAINALLELCMILAGRAGLQQIEGLSLLDWFQKQKLEHMENMMIRIEDLDPALAAKLQLAIDELKKGKLWKKRKSG